MKKQKLLYIIHGIRTGGAEIAFLSALDDLMNAYDFKAILLGRSDPKLVAELPEPVKSRLERYDCSLPSLCVRMPTILKVIEQFSPDILISSLWRSAALATMYKRSHPHVHYIEMVHINKFFHVADRFFTKRAARNADALYVDCESTRQFAQSYLPRGDRAEVLSFLTRKGPEHVTVPPYTEKRFCFVGRLHKMKNVSKAVEAIGWLRRQGVDARLDLYGRDDGDWHVIKATIQKHKLGEYVHWKGEFIPGKRSSIFAKYNFYLQLSHHEGMAMSVVEAMQHGLVCFVTPVGEVAAYIRHLDTGVLVDTTDQQRWNASLVQMKNVLSDEELCRQIAQNGYQFFTDKPDFSTSLLMALRAFT